MRLESRVFVGSEIRAARTLRSNLSHVSYSNFYPFPMARFVALLWCLSLAHAEPLCTEEQSALQVSGKFASDEPITEWFGRQQATTDGEDNSQVFANAYSYLSEWTSPRDLAIQPPPYKVSFADGKSMGFFSAVPSFGEDGNFIALLTTLDSDLHLLENHTIFCSGPNKAHLTQVRIHRRNLLCDWPAEEAEKENFDVFLEDQNGRSIARVLTRRKTGMVKKYHTVACARDAYVSRARPKDYGRTVKQMVEWLEFSVLHGIDHFFVYTYKGTEDAVKEALMPYLKAGLATRIHYDVPQYPEDKYKDMCGWHFDQVIRDCMYRAKSHATWVIPSFDFDEYFHLNSGQFFPDGKIPQDYLRTGWDAIVRSRGKTVEEVRSISFKRFHFARAAGGSLEISSPWRESHLQERLGQPDTVEAFPKFVYNVHLTYDAWWHWVRDFDPKGSTHISINETEGIVNHYRVPNQDPGARTFDDKLVADGPLLEQAIERRFGQKLPALLKRFEGEAAPVSSPAP
eukprot:s2147_g3.t1